MNEREEYYVPPRRRRRRRRKRVSPLIPLLCIAAVVVIWSGVKHLHDNPEETTAPVETTEVTVPVSTEPPLSARFSADDWKLRLVNEDHPLEEEVVPELTTLKNGFRVDSRCYPALQEMMDACRAEGLSPVICSAYRSIEKQEDLYQDKIRELMDQGYSRSEAEEEAGAIVAIPGTSEHHLGLALDIVDESYQLLDDAQEDTPVQQWLMEHSWEYGFVLRYPNNKSSETGIIYEPWHYRYVGKEAAQVIHEQGLCLEEFLELLGG